VSATFAGVTILGMRVGRRLLAGGAALAFVAVGASGSVRTAALAPIEAATRSPYDGTPAEHFAEGADGIVVPPPEVVPDGYIADYTLATRDITAKEVAEALDDVRAALIATRLDRRMLVDHDPEPFIRTLARLYWYAWFDPYLPELREYDSYELPEFAYVATKLTPGVRLAAEPRVAGWITYSAGTTYRGAPRSGTDPWRILRIVTRFVWVYALEVPGDGVGIVVIRNDVTWHVPTDARLDCCQSNVGLHRAAADARAWGVDCERYSKEGMIWPDGGSDLAEVFDVDQPIESLAGCEPERDCSLPVVASSCAVLGE
jgi:hypothetical protein